MHWEDCGGQSSCWEHVLTVICCISFCSRKTKNVTGTLCNINEYFYKLYTHFYGVPTSCFSFAHWPMDYIGIVIGIGDGIGIRIGIGIGNGMGRATMLVGERHHGQRGGAAYFYI